MKRYRYLVGTIRGRFLLISVLFALLATLAGTTAYLMIDRATSEMEAFNTYFVRENELIQGIANDLQKIERPIVLSLLSGEPLARSQLDTEIKALTQAIHDLKQIHTTETDPEAERLLPLLDDLVGQLNKNLDALQSTLSDRSSRYPVFEPILAKTFPSFKEGSVAIDQALDECHESQCFMDVLWTELKSSWLQRTSELRLFLMNILIAGASSARLDDFELYNAKVGESINALTMAKTRGELSLIQGEAVETLNRANQVFVAGLSQLKQLVGQNEWRSDLALFTGKFQPLLDAIRGINREIRAHASGALQDLNKRNETTSALILGVIITLGAMMVAALLLAYVAFRELIDRPIRSMTRAMYAAGLGKPYQFDDEVSVEEMTHLRSAFELMQHQVQGRQARLEAILENASDGIIMIDDRGAIETFNRAAEMLFQYERSEVIGKPLTLLMPENQRAHHQQQVDGFRPQAKSRVIGHEREEEGLRKDGSTFPISIRVNYIELDGRRHFIAMVADISERKAVVDQLREYAEHDALSGLYNRRYFMEELERAVSRMKRGNINLALMYIDLDNFKYVNDTLGHHAGDQLLSEVSQMLHKRLRSGDVLARLGGDEFAVLLYDLPEENVRLVAEDYRQLVESYTFNAEGRVFDIGCSIGVVVGDSTINTKEELLSRADLSCHIAKREGRNRFHVYDNSAELDLANMQADMGWSARIKKCVDENECLTYYQPIVDALSGEVFAYEALMRMPDTDGKVIAPSGFFPAAERFGLTTHLDLWMVRHIVSVVHQLPEGTDVHINLTAQTVSSREAQTRVIALLETESLQRDRLVFEITETTAITHLANAVDFLETLRNMGCRTALDDFGSGYCSFAYLRDLPVDIVKIDGSFVRDIDRDPFAVQMVRAMADIAFSLGKEVVAEYVENATIAERLSEIGINLQQGYHYGKPSCVLGEDAAACPSR